MAKYSEIGHLLKKRYKERMAFGTEYLGGRCVQCGTTENLEFDHIDPSTKSFNISKGWGKPLDILKMELNKCQLLCKNEHLEKTIIEKSTAKHGSLQMYYARKCRCDLCKESQSAWNQKRRLGKKK